MDHRLVALDDLPALEGSAQVPLRLAVAREDHQAARGEVEPVHKQGLRVALLHPVNQTVLLVRGATGHAQELRGLVDDEQPRVAVRERPRGVGRLVDEAAQSIVSTTVSVGRASRTVAGGCAVGAGSARRGTRMRRSALRAAQ